MKLRSVADVTSFLCVAALAAVASCESTLESTTPVEKAVGLDARPISECVGAAHPPRALLEGDPAAGIAFESVSSAKFESPIEVGFHGAQTYVAEQQGLLRRLEGADDAKTVLDIRGIVTLAYDQGLMGFALHPGFPAKPYVYVTYTTPPATPQNAEFDQVLARYETKDGGLTFDASAEKRLLVYPHPKGSVNHNIGSVVFGPDGFLYVGSGEGATPTEVNYQTAQQLGHLLGKILRIDVDGGDPYAIPPGNPFAGGGGRPEIYAYGLRNPWRFAFDANSGKLWAGDVGHLSWEEIDEIVAGGNYGWGNREGFECFRLGLTCDGTYVDPLVVHSHSESGAIVGGVFYYGTAVPALTGKYVYGDAQTGYIWTIPIDGLERLPKRVDQGLPRVRPVSIRLDANGEVIVAAYTGLVARLVAPHEPTLELDGGVRAADIGIGDTNCVDAVDPKNPAPGLFPYDVVTPLPLEAGTTVGRWLALPSDASLTLEADGRVTLPAKAVAIRAVSIEGRPVETQMITRLDDGSFNAETYAWNAGGTDATLANAPSVVTLPSGRVHAIDPASCSNCHTRGTVGLSVRQLDRDGVDYGGRLGNPLATLRHLGMLR